MMDWLKSRGIAAWILCGSALLAIVGLILYIVTSTTGYLAGTAVNVLPILFTILAVIAIAAAIVFADKLDGKLIDLIVIGSAILLIFSFALFVLDRVDIIGEVNFMIINVPDAEKSAVGASIAGFVIYGLSILALAAGTMFSRLTKET